MAPELALLTVGDKGAEFFAQVITLSHPYRCILTYISIKNKIIIVRNMYKKEI